MWDHPDVPDVHCPVSSVLPRRWFERGSGGFSGPSPQLHPSPSQRAPARPSASQSAPARLSAPSAAAQEGLAGGISETPEVVALMSRAPLGDPGERYPSDRPDVPSVQCPRSNASVKCPAEMVVWGSLRGVQRVTMLSAPQRAQARSSASQTGSARLSATHSVRETLRDSHRSRESGKSIITASWSSGWVSRKAL